MGLLKGVLFGFNTPKGPCTHIVYTLALKYSLYRYIGPKEYAKGVHGPFGMGCVRVSVRYLVSRLLLTLSLERNPVL